ncbi:MAG: methyltransferase domain-containing protein [Candidatus Bathyarchaeia archaeon]
MSTETLEHVKDWRKVITNMKDVLKSGGYISQLVLENSHTMTVLTIFGGTR